MGGCYSRAAAAERASDKLDNVVWELRAQFTRVILPTFIKNMCTTASHQIYCSLKWAAAFEISTLDIYEITVKHLENGRTVQKLTFKHWLRDTFFYFVEFCVEKLFGRKYNILFRDLSVL